MTETPKEAYERRKKEKQERRAKYEFEDTEEDIRTAELMDMADRFVTAFEQLALTLAQMRLKP